MVAEPGGHHVDKYAVTHGLDIVAAIAGDDNWGIYGDELTGRTVWARLGWTGQP